MENKSKIGSFGELIYALRKERGSSMYDIEKATGISPSYISRLERMDRDNPSMEYVGRLANFLDIPIDVIKEFFPGFSKGNINDLEALEEVILKQEFLFANKKADINIKLKLRKIINLIDSYVTVDDIRRENEANLLNEIDNLRKDIKSA